MYHILRRAQYNRVYFLLIILTGLVYALILHSNTQPLISRLQGQNLLKGRAGTRSKHFVSSSTTTLNHRPSITTSAGLNKLTNKTTAAKYEQRKVSESYDKTNYEMAFENEKTYLQSPDNINAEFLTKSTREEDDDTVYLYFNNMLNWCKQRDMLQSKKIISIPVCPCISPLLQGYINFTINTELTWAQLHSTITNVSFGGHWSPSECQARLRVAIIVPYRDREAHLRFFLLHMHPILQRQLLDYQIYVVEQESPAIFNKAAMMNAAFLEVAKENWKWDCIVFHDVDVYMEDDRNMIHCRQQSHISLVSSLNRWNYRTRYAKVFGGAIAVTPHMMYQSNGFSNTFFGWGGEDDNFQRRLERSDFTLWRPPEAVGRYWTQEHERDTPNTPEKYPYRPELDSNKDGLSSIDYSLVNHQKEYLYTWLHIRLNVSELNYPIHRVYNYSREYGYCTGINETQKRPLSQVSCQYTCDMEPKCWGYSYLPGQDYLYHCHLQSVACGRLESGWPGAYTYIKDTLVNNGFPTRNMDEMQKFHMLLNHPDNKEMLSAYYSNFRDNSMVKDMTKIKSF